MLKYTDEVKVLDSQIIVRASEKLSKDVEDELKNDDPTPESAKASLNENEIQTKNT